MKRQSIAKFNAITIQLIAFGIRAAADPVPVDEVFNSGGFARAPEGALDIAKVPAPLFRDDRQKSMTAKVTSPDLKHWTRIEDVTGQGRHEAPVVLFWKDKFWLFIDEWKGIAVYQSDDGIQYTRNNLILDLAGKRPDDDNFGSHPGLALAGDRAFIFYHCHAGKTIGTEIQAKDQNKSEIKRSVLQMAELELRDGKMTCDRDK